MMCKPIYCTYQVNYTQLNGEEVSNVYTFKLINKTNDAYENIKIRLVSHEGKIEVVGGQVNIPKGGLYEGTLFIKINKEDLSCLKRKN